MRIICLIVTISAFVTTVDALARSHTVVSQRKNFRYENRQCLFQPLQNTAVSTDTPSTRSIEPATAMNDSLTKSSKVVNIKSLLNRFGDEQLQQHTTNGMLLFMNFNYRTILSTVALLLLVATATIAGPALADEYGVEKDAPTLFTGETVEICTKRGPLGACLKTEMRTNYNDNDVSKKYFRDPSTIIQQQKTVVLQKSDQDNDDGNALIQKLRQQSIDNREKNELYVARKTFEADQSATFGPFDRQVLIMNTDGKTYTLLENPVAIRLKKAGFIDDRRSFITQPTPEEIDAASVKEAGFLSNVLGGGSIKD